MMLIELHVMLQFAECSPVQQPMSCTCPLFSLTWYHGMECVCWIHIKHPDYLLYLVFHISCMWPMCTALALHAGGALEHGPAVFRGGCAGLPPGTRQG